jgi:soluble cytochrome b562
VSSEPVPAQAFCPECGAEVLPGDTFCISCGARLKEPAVTENCQSFQSQSREPVQIQQQGRTLQKPQGSGQCKMLMAAAAAVVILFLLGMAMLLMSGGDKFAKEKESISKAEKAAMSMQLPVVVKPDNWKEPRPTKQEGEQYKEGLDKLIAAETKILAEMQKSDAQISQMLSKASGEEEKKDVLAFREKVRQDRISFVKKVSQGRLSGDTFIVGVGSTWPEVEMVYGKPVSTGKESPGSKEYDYNGIKFEDWIGGGVPPLEVRKKWVSKTVGCVTVTDNNITSDAGVRLGMTYTEVYNILKSKYVNKTYNAKRDTMRFDQYEKGDDINVTVQFAMKETWTYLMFLDFKKGKLVRYAVAPN